MRIHVMRLLVAAGLSCAAAAAQSVPLASSHKPTLPAPATPSATLFVARVNGVGLSQQELQREMRKQFPYANTHGGRIPGEFAAGIQRNALDQIIFEELSHQEAKRRSLAVPANTLKDLLKQARGRFPNKAEFESYAVQEFGSLKGFENQIRRGLLIAILLEQEITQKARVTDAQLRQFYAANKQRFLKPASVRLQSISFNFPAKATPEQHAQARQRAEAILSLAKVAGSYEEFGKLAEKYSEDDWHIMMGDHQWLHRGRLPSAVENVAFRLQKDETSEIIETSEAFVIVRVNGKQAPAQIPYRQVSKSLREDMEKAKLADRRTQFKQKLRARFKVEELR